MGNSSLLHDVRHYGRRCSCDPAVFGQKLRLQRVFEHVSYRAAGWRGCREILVHIKHQVNIYWLLQTTKADLYTVILFNLSGLYLDPSVRANINLIFYAAVYNSCRLSNVDPIVFEWTRH